VTKAAESAGSGASLEEVNRLFAEAKRARREHRDADALELLQRLLAKYPRSVLAHEASVERFRALARLGRTSEAQRYAEAYLAAYPKGFAADEARRVTGSHGGP
jgi:outer membrane protein assembly factor BamD (BamD/ComL family)